MSAEPKRIRVDEGLGPILQEATDHPIVLEVKDRAYRINAEPVDNSFEEKVFAADDPLFGLIGIASSTEGPHDVSRDKYKYLADAYYGNHLDVDRADRTDT